VFCRGSITDKLSVLPTVVNDSQAAMDAEVLVFFDRRRVKVISFVYISRRLSLYYIFDVPFPQVLDMQSASLMFVSVEGSKSIMHKKHSPAV